MTAYEKAKLREQLRKDRRRQTAVDVVTCFGGFATIIAIFFVLAM